MVTSLVLVQFAAQKKNRHAFQKPWASLKLHILCRTIDQYKCNICNVTLVFFIIQIMHPAEITVSVWNFGHPISIFVFFQL